MGLEFTPEQDMLKSELLRLMNRFDDRYWREARLTLIAPISQEMILNYIGSRVLELPRSY